MPVKRPLRKKTKIKVLKAGKGAGMLRGNRKPADAGMGTTQSAPPKRKRKPSAPKKRTRKKAY